MKGIGRWVDRSGCVRSEPSTCLPAASIYSNHTTKAQNSKMRKKSQVVFERLLSQNGNFQRDPSKGNPENVDRHEHGLIEFGVASTRLLEFFKDLSKNYVALWVV